MKKNEIIFFAIIIIAYLLCAFTLNIPTFIHYMFIAMVLVVIIMTFLLKYQEKAKNPKIYKIFYILTIIFLAFYILCRIYESIYHKTLIIDSSTLILPFFAALILSWFFRKRE